MMAVVFVIVREPGLALDEKEEFMTDVCSC
jgi:hypothetical protein